MPAISGEYQTQGPEGSDWQGFQVDAKYRGVNM